MRIWVLPTSMASSTSVHLEVEADVEHGGRVGESTDADEVDARDPCVVADDVEAHPPRHLHRHRRDPARSGGGGDNLDGPADLARRHVVEHDHRRPRLDGFAHLLDAIALDLDETARPTELCPAHRVGDPHPAEVVVLDEHPVAEGT